jgi:SAM-dependent methyltransferase
MMPSKTLPLPEMYSDPEYIAVRERFHEIMTYVYESKTIVSYFNNVYHKIQQSLIEKYSLRDEIIIDLGCGLGAQFKHCFHYARQYWVGLDDQMDLLQIIRKRYPDVQLVQGDLCQLPFRAGSIHNILCASVLEHIYYLEHTVSEIKRVLTPSGLFFMTIPMEDGFLWNTGRRFSTQRNFEKQGMNYKKFISIEHCNTAQKIIGLLKNHFEPVMNSYYPFYIPSINFNLFLNSVLKKLI